MAWTCNFTQDTAADGLGTVTATFTDDDGVAYPVYSRQVKTMSPDDCSAFAREAKEFLASRQAEYQKRKSITDAAITQILAELGKS